MFTTEARRHGEKQKPKSKPEGTEMAEATEDTDYRTNWKFYGPLA